jgi:hypothetical protein
MGIAHKIGVTEVQNRGGEMLFSLIEMFAIYLFIGSIKPDAGYKPASD